MNIFAEIFLSYKYRSDVLYLDYLHTFKWWDDEFNPYLSAIRNRTVEAIF